MPWMIPLVILLAAGSDTATRLPAAAGVGTWPGELGSHRAVVQVSRPSDAVWLHLPWRRRDARPDNKAILMFDAATGKRLANVAIVSLTPACGEIVFQPATAPGKYYVYYLPASRTGTGYFPEVAYDGIQETSDKAWRSRVGLAAGSLEQDAWRKLPRAQFVSWEAIDAYDEFTSMDEIATAEEVGRLLSADPRADYLLFPENREHPIRMSNNLPKRWVDARSGNCFEGKACRGEFYAFQVGILAARRTLKDVAIVIEDSAARSPSARPIPASAIRCFNQGGIASGGQPFRKTVAVDKGKVAALWFGVQIPTDAEPGWYDGAIRVGPKGELGKRIALRLEIDKEVLSDAGDSQPWRHSRLRWLDSKIAADDEPAAPFTPLEIRGKKIGFLGRDLELDANGLPGSIRRRLRRRGDPPAGGRAAAAGRPYPLCAGTAGRDLVGVHRGRLRVRQAIVWNGNLEVDEPRRRSAAAVPRGNGIRRPRHVLHGGHCGSHNGGGGSALGDPAASRGGALHDGPGTSPAACGPPRSSGAGTGSTTRTAFWPGDVNAGLRCQWFGENYRFRLVNVHYHDGPLCLPPAWHNEGRGGCTLREEPGDRVALRATSGPRTVPPGETLHFNFALLITPLKPLLTDNQWAQRYYHAYQPPERVVREGANVVNIHHGTDINPYINYPFLRDKELKRYAGDAHAKGLKARIYYSTRELSNHAAELWALRSLGDEVLVSGPGGGPAWLQEHLDPPYVPGWCMPAVHDVAWLPRGRPAGTTTISKGSTGWPATWASTGSTSTTWRSTALS